MSIQEASSGLLPKHLAAQIKALQLAQGFHEKYFMHVVAKAGIAIVML